MNTKSYWTIAEIPTYNRKLRISGKKLSMKEFHIEDENNPLPNSVFLGLSQATLAIACMTNDLELINKLADTESEIRKFFKIAIKHKHFDAVKLLLSKGMPLDNGLLKYAIECKQFEIATFIVENGLANPNKACLRAIEWQINHEKEWR